MKIICATLNVLLIIPVIKLLLVATQLYRNHDYLHGYAISNSQVYEFEKPYIILSAVYIVTFILLAILNLKRKYLAGIIISVLAFAYFIVVLAINNI